MQVPFLIIIFFYPVLVTNRLFFKDDFFFVSSIIFNIFKFYFQIIFRFCDDSLLRIAFASSCQPWQNQSAFLTFRIAWMGIFGNSEVDKIVYLYLP